MRAHSKPATAAGCWLALPLPSGCWWWIAIAVVLAYGLAWAAHLFVEHNMPATFDDPLYSWWADQRTVFLMHDRPAHPPISRNTIIFSGSYTVRLHGLPTMGCFAARNP